MDQSLQPLIDEQYERIVNKMRGPTTLFGNSIDIGDLKQTVVAAYYMAITEGQQRQENYNSLTRKLEGYEPERSYDD